MNQQVTEKLRILSKQDLAVLGVQHVAYVKRVVMQDDIVWSIHAADGTQLAVVDKRDVAFAAVKQYDLEPVSVH